MDFRLDGLKVKYLGINFQDITVNNVTDVSKLLTLNKTNIIKVHII